MSLTRPLCQVSVSLSLSLTDNNSCIFRTLSLLLSVWSLTPSFSSKSIFCQCPPVTLTVLNQSDCSCWWQWVVRFSNLRLDRETGELAGERHLYRQWLNERKRQVWLGLGLSEIPEPETGDWVGVLGSCHCHCASAQVKRNFATHTWQTSRLRPK